MSNSLLYRINSAVKEMDRAHEQAETAREAYQSRAMIVGNLLVEAKKAATVPFDKFLEGVTGLSRSRAYELISMAEGRTTEEEVKEDTRERVKKHRERKAEAEAKVAEETVRYNGPGNGQVDPPMPVATIMKLLAMTDTDNDNEALSFLRKAQAGLRSRGQTMLSLELKATPWHKRRAA
jgi:hypothetical protein